MSTRETAQDNTHRQGDQSFWQQPAAQQWPTPQTHMTVAEWQYQAFVQQQQQQQPSEPAWLSDPKGPAPWTKHNK